MLNVEAGVATVVTLPMVTSLVSATLEHESGALDDSITGLNICTIGVSERFVISSYSSHHSGTNASGAKDDSIIRSTIVPPVMTEAVVTSYTVTIMLVPETGTKVTSPVHASLFQDSDSREIVKEDAAGPSYTARQDLLMGSQELDAETLHQVFVSQWNVSNDSLLDDYDVSRKFVDYLAPPALFSRIRKMDYHYLFMKKSLDSECEKQDDLLKAREEEIENLKAQLPPKETGMNMSLNNEKEYFDGKVAELQSSVSTKDFELKDLNVAVHALETTCFGLCDRLLGYERLKEQIEEFQDIQMNIVNDKVAKLDANLLEMALHLGEKFYPHLLTTLSGRSRAIKKGMKDGLSTDIDHGKAGRSQADVVAYNPAVEANYNSTLQRLYKVDLSLLFELKSHTDSSVKDIINLLGLEGLLADAPGMNDLQPNVDQLMQPAHRTEDQVVLGETPMSFSLSVTHFRVESIRENVAAKRLAFIGV
nr:hypothetical protein [Tanacetum cinerariifolium]